MREQVKTFEVEEKEYENIYCDLCGAKTEDPFTIYIKDKDADNVAQRAEYLTQSGNQSESVQWIGNQYKNIQWIGEEAHALTWKKAYYLSKHDICSNCIRTFDGGVEEAVLPTKSITHPIDQDNESFVSMHRSFFIFILSMTSAVSLVFALSLRGLTSDYLSILTLISMVSAIYVDHKY